ncbi:MAG TPA: tRNA-dihydrouridine synthase family protein, partial [Planctomycetota bacterium]|nr:tRNA-dihydrouridine synthase family protein [Planctomycetota bacterium]
MDFRGHTILAPLTRGGNLPFRRLCVALGAKVTVSEMAYARQLLQGSGSERALLRKHASESCFGVQIAASNPDDAVRAGALAVERGAAFVDLNAGCPIHDVVRRGMGATLLQRPATLARIAGAMARALPVPVTVKIRTGWCEGDVNAPQVAQRLEEVGVAAIAVHGRTREQRYSRAADWDLIARIAAERAIPVVGNGDILTHYEARRRAYESACASLMVGRGALIKPWIFTEIERGEEWLPTARERVALYLRFVSFLKEHFGDDERGKKKAMYFLPWHLGFFCRYRPLPEREWEEASRAHPLLQTRRPEEDGLPPLEQLLRDGRASMH